MKKNTGMVNRVISFVIVVMMVAGFLVTPIQAEAAKKKGKTTDATYAEGDDIAFGFLDDKILSWTILKYDDTTKTAFVVCRQPLSSRTITAYRKAIQDMYRDTKTNAGYVRWSENYWRGWLNKTFLETCFSAEERKMIKKTTLSEKDAKNSLLNYYHDTSIDALYVNSKVKNSLNMAIYNSQTTTTDYIFFLSSDEYTEYKDTMKNETKCLFPLRTNAYDDPTMGLFGNDTDKLIYRLYYYAGDSIRPAMNIQLGEPTADSSSDSSSTSSDTKKSATKDNKATTDTTKAATTTAATATTTKKAEDTKPKKAYANNGKNTGNINLPDDSSYAMANGTTAQVAFDMDYLNSTDKNYTITYKSSNASVFTVDSDGVITATGKGTATITARMKKSNGKVYTMSCRIDVT